MMTEDDKIRKVIEKYEKFFCNTISDVAQSKKGKWLFWEYDAEYRCYDSFFQFKTAEELEKIIAQVLTEEFNNLIEVSAENIQRKLDKIDMNEVVENSYDFSIPKLQKNIEVLISEYQKSSARLEAIFKSLSTIFDSLKER